MVDPENNEWSCCSSLCILQNHINKKPNHPFRRHCWHTHTHTFISWKPSTTFFSPCPRRCHSIPSKRVAPSEPIYRLSFRHNWTSDEVGIPLCTSSWKSCHHIRLVRSQLHRLHCFPCWFDGGFRLFVINCLFGMNTPNLNVRTLVVWGEAIRGNQDGYFWFSNMRKGRRKRYMMIVIARGQIRICRGARVIEFMFWRNEINLRNLLFLHKEIWARELNFFI